MDDLYAALPEVSSLTIVHTELHHAQPITPELSYLCLKDCNISRLSGDFFSGSALTALEVSRNGLTEVPNLRSIQETITFVDLSNNLIEDTKMLRVHFKALRTLHLSNNLIRTFVMPMASFWPKLIHISLINNRIIELDMGIHYQNIDIYLTDNPLMCSNVMTSTEDCQPDKHLRLHCPCEVTLIGIQCYPGNATPSLKRSQCSAATATATAAAIAAAAINRFYSLTIDRIYQIQMHCFIIIAYEMHDVV